MLRLVVLGGSGASTPELIDALARWPGASMRRPDIDVTLVGRNTRKLEVVAKECRRRIPLAGPPIRVFTSAERRPALRKADVVLVQVRVGGLAARVFDESFPREIGYPGDETMGPGGFANAIRTVPAMRTIWRDVADYAPQAIVVNLTSPSGIVVAAARREFEVNVVSVCESPVGHLTAIARKMGRTLTQVRKRYVGMSHVGWYVPEGPEEMPMLAELVVGQDLFDVAVQAAIAAPWVRYYVHPDRALAAQGMGTTRAQSLLRLEAEMLGAYQAAAADVPRRGADWYALAVVPFIDAWANGALEPLVVGTVLDVPVAGVPAGLLVERAVAFPASGTMVPLDPPPLPLIPQMMLDQHAQYERLTIEAIASGGARVDLLRALLAGPMVKDYARANAIVDRILSESPTGERP